MKKNGKNNRVVLLVLTTLSLAIWGVILNQFLENLGERDETVSWTASPHDTVQPQMSPRETITIDRIDKLRNPFEQESLKKRKKKILQRKPVVDEVTQPPDPPALIYLGVVSDNDGKIAILRNLDGETRFCAEGDSFLQAHIESISLSEITVTRSGQSFLIPMQK